MKIFMGMKEIASYYNNLQSGFDELGVESFLLNTGPNPFRYGDKSKQNWLARLGTFVGSRYGRSKGLLKVWWYGCIILVRLIALVWALPQFDTFIFSYGTSFFFLYDLPLLKMLGKKIIFVFHGSDARPAYLDGAITTGENAWSTERIIRWDRQRKKLLQRVEKYADTVICHPLYGHLLEKPFLNFTTIGIPFIEPEIDLDSIESRSDDTIQILHAPSSPIPKGTMEIRAAIQSLQKKGFDIKFVELKGLPHHVVLNKLANCDFVIDQLYTDTPIAGLGTEACNMGKPTITGTYNMAELKRHFSEEIIDATYLCHPDALSDAIEHLITDKEYRLALGIRAKTYVEKNWTISRVSQNYVKIISDEIDKQWLCTPDDIRTVNGWGLREADARRSIKSVIQRGGEDALQLADKPELKERLIKFANS